MAETVLGALVASGTVGVSVPTLVVVTGLSERTVRGALYDLYTAGRLAPGETVTDPFTGQRALLWVALRPVTNGSAQDR